MPATSLSPHPSTQDTVGIAYSHARQLGLSHDDALDCAMDFRLHLLRSQTPRLDSAAWLHRCARNFACNYLRTQIRRKRREGCDGDPALRGGRNPLQEAVSGPGPKTLALRQDLWNQLFTTLRHLSPEQQELFMRYHVRQQSLAELSQRTGRTIHALQQALHNIHRRLAHLMLQQGWSAADAKQLFNASLSSCVPRIQS